jgi:hypothetical protein
MSDAGRQEKVAGNEPMHRRVNEAIERGRWPGDEDATSFRCECARRGCSSLIELTREQYEALRADPRRFVVVPGHEEPEIEDVIEAREGYLVVEKRGAAARMAEATDPRASEPSAPRETEATDPRA